MATKIGHLRDAATLMVAAKSKFWTGAHIPNAHPSLLDAIEKFDYRLLMLKRTHKSKFLPNIYIFPGGVMHETDFSSSWLDILDKADSNILNLPPVFKRNMGFPVPPAIAFKICAIRETFEESGILLCKDSLGNMVDMESNKKNELSEWRDKVHKDPSQFVKMCHHYGFSPSLKETNLWANWMTPAHMDEAHGGTSRRFDTLFFIHSLPYVPREEHDNKETVQSQWATPVELIYHYRKGNLTIGPPQLFELSRLCNFKSYNELKAFASDREKQGVLRYLGIRMDSKDGYLLALPGDDLYPDDPIAYEQEGPAAINQTTGESSARALRLNRLVFDDINKIGNNTVLSSVGSECGHSLPLSESVILEGVNMV